MGLPETDQLHDRAGAEGAVLTQAGKILTLPKNPRITCIHHEVRVLAAYG